MKQFKKPDKVSTNIYIDIKYNNTAYLFYTTIVPQNLDDFPSIHSKTYFAEIEQLEAEKEEKGQALSIVDDELGLIQQQLDDLKKELASQANSWNRKKSCLEVGNC